MSNQETPRRRRFRVWWGVVLGLALGLCLFPVLALRASRALDIADPLATPGPTPTSYWVFWIGAALAAFVPAVVLGCFHQLTREPQKALCILTTGLGSVQGTMVESVRRLIEAEIPEQIRPDLPVGDMAYLLVRVGESFIYNDLLTGGTPDTEKARLAFRLILSRD